MLGAPGNHQDRRIRIVCLPKSIAGKTQFLLMNEHTYMECFCGAVLQIDKLREINSSLVNLYHCPGGPTRHGRERPAHLEPYGGVESFTRPLSKIDEAAIKAVQMETEPFGKAIKADPTLYTEIEAIHGEQFHIVFFLESFCEEHFSRFCHQTPIHGYDDWILTGVDEFDGIRLPFIRKQIPPALDINGVQFFRLEIEDLLDLSNATRWSSEVFSNG